MNEIEIYRKIKEIIVKKKKMVNYAWLGIILVSINSVVMVYLPLLGWATMVTIFVPLSVGVVFLFLSIRNEYITAKKYPMVYNNWIFEEDFIYNLLHISKNRTQPNPHHVKLQNYALGYIDDIINTYYEDKKKLSNGFYNSIINTSLVEEIKFYEKYKNFIKDMESYREVLNNDIMKGIV
jgi:hypothetical protein